KDAPTVAKPPRVSAAPVNLHEGSFLARADVPVQEEEDHLWVLAIIKRCCIYSLAQDDPCPVETQAAQCLVAKGEGATGELIGDVFGLRSPRTAIGPTDCDGVLRDRRLQGRARRLQGEKPEVKQQEALEVERVARWERLVAGQTLCDVDAYVLGGEPFALYSRSSWSDLKSVHSIWIDFVGEDCRSGFVETRTTEHTTNDTVCAKRRAMPLVAPFPGVSEASWVDSWWQTAKRLGVDWSAVPSGPLVRAPNNGGYLGLRRRSSSEAVAMLCSALGLEGVRRRFSHVLKCTTMTWIGKRGFGGREGLLLGHHATGSSSLAYYNRELLSVLLRVYRSMLQEIRNYVFKPDNTRSGWLTFQGNDLPTGGHGQVCSGSVADRPLKPILNSSTAADRPAVSDPASLDASAGSGSKLADLGEPAFSSWVERAVVEDEPQPSNSSSSSPTSSSEASGTEEQLVAMSGVSQPYEIDEPCWQH
ncbi:unnamed protein product, partial [Symbiodinium sp. CCMP2456]